jgi:peroxiredoxin
MKKFIILLSVLIITFPGYAQNNQVKTGIVGQKISDFTLPTYQGQELSIQSLRGKNVLLVVSRGKYADNKWCTICQYQYADYADLALSKSIREKYNLEVIFLFPYSKDTLKSWVKVFPSEMQKIEKWKNPDGANATSKQLEWANFARANYPKKFDFTDKKVPLPLPVLADEKQEVSKGLDLLRMEWDGGKTMQNIPAIYIIDKEGIIKFKYISQNTTDRPTSDYIINFIEKML